jgi:hypothetical protein
MRNAVHGGGHAAAGGEPRVSRPRRRAVTVRRVPSKRGHASLRFVTGGALILALAGVAFGARGYLEASTAESQTAALRGTVSTLESRLSMDEARAAHEQKRVGAAAAQAARAGRQSSRVASQLADIPPQVQALQADLAWYSACLPQLQREITGLVISWHMGPFKASPDYATLVDKAPISSACAR